MASLILFFGSGASVPFGLPTMKELVREFEKQLRNSLDRSGQAENAEELKVMVNLYKSIKDVLADVYSYVDLESIFSVLKSISEDIKYSDLGFTSTYVVSRLDSDPKRRIALDDQKYAASKLLEKYRNFVRERCNDSNIKEEKVNEVFSDFLHI
jgi:hypothetical protein